jgi:putative transcriptional regulator
MILFRIKELIAEKEKLENRKITLQEVTQHTGVNRTSLSKMQNPDMRHSTTTSAIEALCRYFNCRVEDVMVYEPENENETN